MIPFICHLENTKARTEKQSLPSRTCTERRIWAPRKKDAIFTGKPTALDLDYLEATALKTTYFELPWV